MNACKVPPASEYWSQQEWDFASKMVTALRLLHFGQGTLEVRKERTGRVIVSGIARHEQYRLEATDP